MKKIINGKKYDTETATEIASWSNGISYSDFRYCKETLYRKCTGEYFLYGRGGAMTGYAESCGNNARCEGEDIIPYSENEAREWIEQHANEKYEDIFGECAE